MIEEEPTAQEKAAARPIMTTALRKAGWAVMVQWAVAVVALIWLSGAIGICLVIAALSYTLSWLSFRKGATEVFGDLRQ